MLDQDIVNIAKDRINLEIGEQKKWLHTEIQRIKAEMAGRGLLHSSIIVKRVADVCVEAVKNRAQLVWQILFRFITTTGISYTEGLSEELKALIALHLPSQLADLKDQVIEISQFAGAQKMHTTLETELDAARSVALAKVGTEIDLFVHSLKRKADLQEGKSTSTVFNVYSPVGSIQIGDNSIANVNQMVDTETRQRIINALEEIESQLGDPDLDIALQKEELIEVVKETGEELQKEKPNVTRLRSLLTTVGTSIQLISSLKPAYETLKQALTFLGISLP
ncbi:MAG: hypothetical protein ACYC7J_20755 [Syntrophales bacterium]